MFLVPACPLQTLHCPPVMLGGEMCLRAILVDDVDETDAQHRAGENCSGRPIHVNILGRIDVVAGGSKQCQ